MDIAKVIEWKYVVAAVLYSSLGVIMLTICFVLLDVLTPKIAIWKELVERQNVAVAIFLGAVAYGIATIIASAIHG
jgi:putative membrane protein